MNREIPVKSEVPGSPNRNGSPDAELIAFFSPEAATFVNFRFGQISGFVCEIKHSKLWRICANSFVSGSYELFLKQNKPKTNRSSKDQQRSFWMTCTSHVKVAIHFAGRFTSTIALAPWFDSLNQIFWSGL